MAVRAILVFETDLGWHVHFTRLIGPFRKKEWAIEAAEGFLHALTVNGERGQIIIAANAP